MAFTPPITSAVRSAFKRCMRTISLSIRPGVFSSRLGSSLTVDQPPQRVVRVARHCPSGCVNVPFRIRMALDKVALTTR